MWAYFQEFLQPFEEFRLLLEQVSFLNSNCNFYYEMKTFLDYQSNHKNCFDSYVQNQTLHNSWKNPYILNVAPIFDLSVI